MIRLIAYDKLNRVLATKEIDKARYNAKILRSFQTRISNKYGATVAVKVIR